MLTTPGEKIHDPYFGSNVNALLFENVDEISAVAIRDEIENSLKNYEPRIVLEEILVDPDYDMNQFDVTITYRIVGIDVPPTQLEFALLPSR